MSPLRLTALPLPSFAKASTATRRRPPLVAAALVLTLSGGGLALTALPASAAVCGSSVVGDVNGDGHADLAVGEPGNHDGAGSVHLFYGTSSGLVTDSAGTALNDQYLDQDSPGVPGGNEEGDRFGAATALADLNGDGCSDLVVAAPGEDAQTGSISVLYGSKSGVTTTGAQKIGPPSSTQPLRGFGAQLTAGDLNGDGIADLVATAGNPQTAHGSVVVLYGDAKGLNRGTRAPSILQGDSPGVGVEPIGFASGVATGDFDGDGTTELAVGQSAADDEGQVAVLEPGRTGFTRTTSLTLRMKGVPALTQKYEGFGRQLAVGDTNADGRDELAVGVFQPLCGPACEDDGDSASDEAADGAVAVFKGAAAGLSAQGVQLWTQDSPGVIGTSSRDGFGAALAFGRLDAGPTDDLIVGVPFDDVSGKVGAGSVSVLLGSTNGLTTAGEGGSTFTQDTPGIAGAAETDDHFGSTLSTVQLSRTGPAGAVIGVPDEALGSRRFAGQITQLAPNASGPKAASSRSINADTAGVQGVAEQGDTFGRSLG